MSDFHYFLRYWTIRVLQLFVNHVECVCVYIYINIYNCIYIVYMYIYIILYRLHIYIYVVYIYIAYILIYVIYFYWIKRLHMNFNTFWFKSGTKLSPHDMQYFLHSLYLHMDQIYEINVTK